LDGTLRLPVGLALDCTDQVASCAERHAIFVFNRINLVLLLLLAHLSLWRI
jgi:hypothetical protein